MENTCNDLKMVTETISYKIPKNYIISEKKGEIIKNRRKNEKYLKGINMNSFFT